MNKLDQALKIAKATSGYVWGSPAEPNKLEIYAGKDSLIASFDNLPTAEFVAGQDWWMRNCGKQRKEYGV